MRIDAVRVFVHDREAACVFYGETLGLPAGIRDAAAGWAEFDVGGAVPGVERVAPGDAEGGAPVGRFPGVSLAVDDIEAAYAGLLARGARFHGAPERQHWGGVLAHLDDPEGNTLTLPG